jgi:hypothetical protein
MDRLRATVGVVTTLLVLAGCGGADDSTEPVPDDPASSAATSAPPSSLPSISPTVEESPPIPPSPSGVLSLTESCQAVVDDQQDALDTLRDHVRNPLNSDVEDLDRLRSELLAGELSAPEPLRQELDTQVRVLDALVQGLRDGNVPDVDVTAFQDARDRIATLCEEAAR